MKRNDTDKMAIAQEHYDVPKSLYDGRYTKTTNFLLPAIDLNIRKKIISQFFVNAFLKDEEMPVQVNLPVFVLFKTVDLKNREWMGIYGYLQSKDEYVTDYNVGKDGFEHQIMFVFNVPQHYEDLYYKFKRGKYSEFPEEYKTKFPQYVKDEKGNVSESVIWGAMYKSSTLKALVEKEFCLEPDILTYENEFWERPRPHRETFRYPKSKLDEFNEQIKSLSLPKSERKI